VSQRFVATLPVLAAALPVALVALPHDWRFLPVHLFVLAAILAVAWRGPLVDRAVEGVPGWRWLLMAVTSSAMVWALVGGSTRAQWGMIDDHEIQDFIGAGRDRIPARDLSGLFAAHSEIGSPPFTIPRYRPTYYLFRLIECSAWGRHIEPWMILRLVLFAITATLAFDLLRQWLGFVAGGVSLAFLATLWMWPKIFVTLGPAEAYAAPAVMAFAWTATTILRGHKAAGVGLWAALAIAAVIAIGAKENFVILAPLAALVGGIEWRRGRLGLAGAIACGTMALAALWVAIVVGASIAVQGGRDLYDRPLGLSGFVRSGDGSALRAIRKLAGYGLPLLAATAWMAFTWQRGRATAPSGRRTLLAVGTVLGLAAISQFFFYRGEVFKKSHYDLPFVPLVCTLEIGFLAAAAGWRGGSAADRRLRRRLLVPGVLAVAAMALGGDHARQYTQDYARETAAFTTLVDQVAAACRAEPERPVEFFIADDLPGNHEPLHAVVRFLRAQGVVNRFFLNPHALPAAGDAAGASRRDHELAALSRVGGVSFEPWSQLPRAALPIAVWFSGDAPVDRQIAFRFR
jgi:hypothetical protein